MGFYHASGRIERARGGVEPMAVGCSGVRVEAEATGAQHFFAHVDPIFVGLATRTGEVKRRCRTVLQTKAGASDAVRAATTMLLDARQAAQPHVDSTLALV